MIGPFKPAPGNFKFVFVLIDKFSKWIKYMPLVKAAPKRLSSSSIKSYTDLGFPTA